jgi:hypothetical protein
MCYVVIDLIQLFDIPYLKTFSFFNVFGAIIILSIVRMKVENKSDSETDDRMVRSIANAISGALTILMLWGLCYIIKYLFM